MIPITAIMIAVALILALVAYSVADRDNVLHLNLIACTCAGIMTALIGAAFDAEIIYDTVGGVVHTIDSPLVGTGFYAGSVVIFGIEVLLVYIFITDLIRDSDTRRNETAMNSSNGYDSDITGGISHTVVIVGVCLIISILSVLTNFLFIAITNEAGGAGEAATVQTFMGIHPWLLILTLLLVIASIVAGLKISRRLVGA